MCFTCPCSCCLVLAVSRGKVTISAQTAAIPPNTKGVTSNMSSKVLTAKIVMRKSQACNKLTFSI